MRHISDGLGYAFPYDDVHLRGKRDLSKNMADGSPWLLAVVVKGAQYDVAMRGGVWRLKM